MPVSLVFKIMYNNNMKFIFKNVFMMVLLTFITLFPVLIFAQGTLTGNTTGGNGTLTGNTTGNTNTSSVTITNPIKVNNIQDFIKTILEGVIKIGLPIVALAIIYSGFLFVAARGKPEALKKAKDALLYSIIGAAILLGSWAIAQLISDTVTNLK